MVKDMSDEQLAAMVLRLRTAATSAPTLSAKLKSESDSIRARKPTGKTAARRAALDAL